MTNILGYLDNFPGYGHSHPDYAHFLTACRTTPSRRDRTDGSLVSNPLILNIFPDPRQAVKCALCAISTSSSARSGAPPGLVTVS